MYPETGSAGYLIAGNLISGNELTAEGGSTTIQVNIGNAAKTLLVATLIGALATLAEAGVAFGTTGVSIVAGASTATAILGWLAIVGLGVGMAAGAIIVGVYLVKEIYTAYNFYYRRWYAFKRIMATLV